MISRYLELIRLSLCEIAEKTENQQTFRVQSCPKKVNFDTFLSIANPLLRAPSRIMSMETPKSRYFFYITFNFVPRVRVALVQRNGHGNTWLHMA